MKLAKDTLYFNTTHSNTTSVPVRAIGRGYCFDCEHPVEMEHSPWWVGDYAPPKTCQECGGRDVEFMGRVAERLWQRLRAAQFVEWAKTNFTHLPPWGVAASWEDTVHWVRAFAGEDFSDVNGELAQAMWADYINTGVCL